MTHSPRHLDRRDALVGVAALLVLCWWGLHQRFFKDFYFEAQPAVQRLLHGDLHGFLTLSPVYSGSMLARAPFFLAGGALGGVGGAYRVSAVACAATLLVLALSMARSQRSAGTHSGTRWLTVVLCTANPVAGRALQMGHPEEILASALAVGGALLAGRTGRRWALLAGLAIGAATACKQWGVIALPVALVLTAPRQRLTLAGGFVAGAVALFAPFALSDLGGFVASNHGALATPAFINGENVWRLVGALHWAPLGDPRSPIHGEVPDAFAASYSHLVIVALPFLLAGLASWRQRRRVNGASRSLREGEALLLLAACLLLRGLLDPWNIVYYQLPFLIALLLWEARHRPGVPVLSLAATAGTWIAFQTIGTNAVGDGTRYTASTAVFCAWALPAALLMVAVSLRMLPRLAATGAASHAGRAPAQAGRAPSQAAVKHAVVGAEA